MSDYYYSTVDENSPETRLRMAYRQACTQLAHVAIGEAPARVPALMEANLSSRELSRCICACSANRLGGNTFRAVRDG